LLQRIFKEIIERSDRVAGESKIASIKIKRCAGGLVLERISQKNVERTIVVNISNGHSIANGH